MIKDGTRGKQDYKRPVNYEDPQKDQINCYFQVYHPEDNNNNHFKGTTELRPFLFKNILTHVNLAMSEEGILIAPEIEMAEIRSRVSNLLQPAQKKRRAQVPSSITNADTSDGDIVRVQVEPQQQTEEGPRRSARVRTARLYID